MSSRILTCPALCLTPQILGNNECFEPYTSNIYVRRVLSGEFTVRSAVHPVASARCPGLPRACAQSDNNRSRVRPTHCLHHARLRQRVAGTSGASCPMPPSV